jgi:energy-coupling factor transporter ATP-binding protein EcfA2
MHNYIEYLHISKDFIPAVKVEYFMNDVQKLAKYVPNEKSLDVIRNFCINENGSNVIIGAYGSGKSHLVSLLSNIMSCNYEIEDYKCLIDRIRSIDEEIANLFIKRLKKKNKRFVVIPPYNAKSFEQAILVGINKALEREGYSDVIIKNSYNKAVGEIEKWKREFPQTFDEFCKILRDEYFIKFETFTEELKSFNEEYYRIFIKIYPRVTSGAEFFQYDTDNIIEILKQINNIMMKRGYSGLDIIFDEFGSFLENNLSNINITLIQELAELANNEGNCISFYIITHKDLTLYGGRISDDVVTEWRKVEGRFRRFTIHQSPTDVYKIITSILVKDKDKFSQFFEANKETFLKMYNRILQLPTFKELTEENILEDLIKGCYPLAPLATYALYKLSDKIAQSNRTLFTFLISDDENSLGDFIKNSNNNFWLTGDIIYDYFEVEIWRENKQSNIYKTWQEINRSINKVDNLKIAVQIIKVIGLIYIIDDFDRIKPNKCFISLLLPQYSQEEIDECLKKLIDKKIIFYRKIYDMYKFYEGSDLDVDRYIDKIIEKYNKNIDAIDVLNRYFLPPPLIPRRYNDKYYINRFLESRFVRLKDLEVNKAIKDLSDGYKDGIVYYVIPESIDEISEFLHNIGEFKDITNLIILLPKKEVKIQNLIFRYWAILKLLEDKVFLNSEEFIEKELLLYKEEIAKEINIIIYNNFNNDFKNSYVINEGNILLNVNNRYSLQVYASMLMEKYFDKTIKINNELVNKNVITPTMKSVEAKVINSLWDSFKNNNKFKFKRFSAEHTTAKSVLINSNILKIKDDYTVSISYNDLDKNNPIRCILEEMKNFLNDCRKEEKNFHELYSKIKSKPYGIKDGVVPLLFAVAIIDNLDNIYIKRNGIYEDLDGKLLVKMIERPSDYFVSIDLWEEEKEEYILNLEDLFKDYIDWQYRTKNRLAALYEGIKKYYILMPKFTRETSYLSEDTKRIREIMSNDYSDYKKLFFHIIPNGRSYIEVIEIMKQAVDELNQFIDRFKITFSKNITDIFDGNSNNIRNSIENWFNSVDLNVKNYIFDLKTNLFMKYIQSPEEDYIKGLIKTLTGFDLEYLNDDIYLTLINDLKEIKNKISNANIKKNNDFIRIDVSIDSKKKAVSLKEVQLSAMGKLLKKKIINDIENFNYAVDYDEKIFILISVLQNIIE